VFKSPSISYSKIFVRSAFFAVASPPQFNIVQGTAGNQIAEGLMSNKNVIKAYVVGSEVSSQQELDRKIVTTASI